MRLLLVLLALLLPLGAQAQNEDSTEPEAQAPPPYQVYTRTDAAWTRFNLALAERYITPGFARLGEETKKLGADAGAFCEHPSEESLATVRAGFLASTDAWARVEHLRTGPASIGNRAERIYFWPERKNVTQRQLAALLSDPDVASVTAEKLAGGSVAVQGLPALEMLLYDEDNVTALLAGDAGRCAVVRAIAANVADIGADLAHEWSAPDGFLATLAHPETPNPFFSTAPEATKRLFNDLLTFYQLITDTKLLAPLGTTIDQARPKLTEGWRSGRSLAMIKANIETARSMYGRRNEFGLHSLLLEGIDPHETDQVIENALDATEDALQKVPEPLDQAVLDPKGRQAAMLVLHYLHQVYEQTAGRYGPSVDMSVGFNGLDGD